MADAINANVAEAHKLAADLGTVGAAVTMKAAKAVQEAAAVAQKTGRQYAPRRSGALRASITCTVRGLSAEIGPTVEYAPYVEYGTAYERSKPFMWPATTAAQKSLDKAIGDIAEVREL